MSPRPTVRAVLLALAFASAARAADAPPAAPTPETRDYDQIRLDLALRLDLDAGALSGVARHHVAALADGLAQVRMHLEDMQVASVTVGDATPCRFVHSGGVLAIDLDRPRARGEEFDLAITYGGRPRSGLWFFRPTPEHPDIPLQVWSQGEGTENRHWFPCYDLPDDRLATSLTVDVPAGLTTLSNGVPGPRTAAGDGRETHVWRFDQEHPSYLVTLVVGTFDDVLQDASGVAVHALVPPGWADRADEVFGRTPDMLRFFAEWTGRPYPWPRYAQVTVWDFHWGGMENTCATTLNMRALHEPGVRPDYSADGLVAHELAHQWFGDLVTCRTFNHLWLNEGFATYFTDLWFEHAEGADAFEVGRLESRDDYMDGVDLAATAARPLPRDVADCGDLEQHQYVKGSSVLHMLRRQLGDDAFRKGIALYLTRCGGRSVTSDELRRALEDTSGRDLRAFFEQWVHRSGYPQLAVSSSWDGGDGAGELVLRVRQTQPATPEMPHFTLPVEVEAAWEGGQSETRTFVLSGAAAEWRVACASKPRRWRVDPRTFLIARIHEERSRAEWELQLAEDPRATGRILAARALGGLGPEAVAALGAATHDAAWQVRAEACTALGKTRAHAAVAHLAAAAHEADSRVRSAALRALGEFPAAWAAPTLAAALRDEPRDYPASEAAAALGRTRAPEAFDALVAALARESHRDVVRREVMNGLAALGDPRGAAVALRYTDYAWGKGAQHRLRHAALDALVKLDPHGAATRGAVLALLDDPYFRMQQWAAGHAADLGLADAVPVLERLLPDVTGPGVKSAFEQALARLRP